MQRDIIAKCGDIVNVGRVDDGIGLGFVSRDKCCREHIVMNPDQAKDLISALREAIVNCKIYESGEWTVEKKEKNVEHDFGAVEFYDDELKELAAFLDGSEYPLCLEEKTTDAAMRKGIIIVYEYSDLMEFDGVWREEIGWGGRTVTSNLGRSIEAVCSSKNGTSWKYKTEIPHESFNLMEDGNIYCEGIVFHSFPGETWEGGY